MSSGYHVAGNRYQEILCTYLGMKRRFIMSKNSTAQNTKGVKLLIRFHQVNTYLKESGGQTSCGKNFRPRDR